MEPELIFLLFLAGVGFVLGCMVSYFIGDGEAATTFIALFVVSQIDPYKGLLAVIAAVAGSFWGTISVKVGSVVFLIYVAYLVVIIFLTAWVVSF